MATRALNSPFDLHLSMIEGVVFDLEAPKYPLKGIFD